MARSLVSFKDVVLAFFTNGVAGVEAMNPAPNPDTMLRAVEHIRASTGGEEQAHGLMDLFGQTQTPTREAAPTPSPRPRGRPVPQAGDTRSYKVQQNGDEIPWIRVPLCTVECEAGDEVQVSFGDGSVSVEA
jgi:hypothetical protein